MKDEKKLIKLQGQYIRMLGNEIDSLARIAHMHGWRSEHIEKGENFREQIREVKKKIKTNNT